MTDTLSAEHLAIASDALRERLNQIPMWFVCSDEHPWVLAYAAVHAAYEEAVARELATS